jgi:hypothetical protein
MMAPNRAEGKNLPDAGLQRVAGTESKETPETNFETFPSFPQGDCNVCGCDTLASAEGSPRWVSGAALVRFGSFVSFDRTTATSGLPRRTDVLRIGGHGSKMPEAEDAMHALNAHSHATPTIAPATIVVSSAAYDLQQEVSLICVLPPKNL